MAWFVFNLLAPFAFILESTGASLIRGEGVDLTWAPVIFIYVPLTAAPWSFGTLLVLGAPMAVTLGVAMRRRPYSRAHLWAFTGLGAFVGAAGIVTWQWWNWMPRPGSVIYMGDESLWARLDWAMIVLMAAATAAAVCNGWRFTMRRALLADAWR